MNARGRPGSRREAGPYEGERFTGGKFGAGAVAAVAVFEPPGLEPTIRHHQAMRDAKQLGVGELDSGARVAVVVENLDAGRTELLVQAIADFANTGGLLQVERHQHHL